MKLFGKHRTHDVAFLARIPAGIPGDCSRKEGLVAEPRQFDPTNPPTVYGLAVVIDPTSFGIRRPLAGDAAAAIYGFIIRPFPISNVGANDPLGSSPVNTTMPCDVMKKGYMTVVVQNTGAAVLNGPVYIRVAATAGALVQGGVEAAPSMATTGAATGGNVGNGTIGSLSSNANTPAVPYTVKFTSPTAFNVLDASGEILGAGVVGTQETLDNGLSFKITAGGTAFAANDSFTISIAVTNILLPNCFFMGPADSNGNVEIAFKQ